MGSLHLYLFLLLLFFTFSEGYATSEYVLLHMLRFVFIIKKLFDIVISTL